MKKLISSFLLVIILLQSCVVYQKTSVSLEEAVDKGKVKLITKKGEKVKYKKIIQKDSIYYGFDLKKLKNVDGVFEWNEITYQLWDTEIESIHIKDKEKSTTRTIFLVLGSIPVVLILGTLIFWSIYGVV